MQSERPTDQCISFFGMEIGNTTPNMGGGSICYRMSRTPEVNVAVAAYDIVLENPWRSFCNIEYYLFSYCG